MVGQVERQALGFGVRFGDGHALAADVDERLGVAHHERPQRQPEQVAVGQRQVVDARDAHGAGLGVQARREVAQRVDPPADAMLRLQHEHVVALPAQFEGRDQAGDAGADDDHALALPRLIHQPFLGHQQQAGRRPRRGFGRWLAAFDRRGLIVQGNPLLWPPESSV